MGQIGINESGLAHVGIQTDVLLSLAKKIIADHHPEWKKRHESISLNLAWVSDEEMRDLNRQHRGKDEPTDVLSFSYAEAGEDLGSEPEWTVGDMMISLDTLKKQAKERGHAHQTEAEILFVHGLLHILGYDHEAGVQEMEKMLAQEQTYLGDNAGLIERAGVES